MLKSYTLGRATLYGDMAIQAFAALTVFWGVAFRRVARRGTWTSQVGLIGAALLALTLSLFGVTDNAMYHAVQTGVPQTAQAINVVSNAFSLPRMLSMICLYIGTGLSAWTTGALPKWRAHPGGSGRIHPVRAAADLGGGRLRPGQATPSGLRPRT